MGPHPYASSPACNARHEQPKCNQPVRLTVDEHLAAAARLRAQLDGLRVTEKEISAAKRAGRP